jgi:hypothetical protein
VRTSISYSCQLVVAASVALTAILVGCQSQDISSNQKVPEWAERIDRNMQRYFVGTGSPNQDFTPEDIARVRNRISLLKSGLTPARVFRELGLRDCPAYDYASGPPEDYGIHFQLGTNCWMELIFDMTKEPPTYSRGAVK